MLVGKVSWWKRFVPDVSLGERALDWPRPTPDHEMWLAWVGACLLDGRPFEVGDAGDA